MSALVNFKMLDTMSWSIIFFAILVFLGALELQAGAKLASFHEPYPAAVRYFVSAISYTIANLIGGGPLPFIAAELMKATGGNTRAIIALVSTIIVVSFIAIVSVSQTPD